MDLYSRIPPSVRAELHCRTFAPGEVILPAEEENYFLCFLRKGKAIAFVRGQNGETAGIFVYEADSVFGEIEQFYHGCKPVEISAMTECTVEMLHRRDLCNWLQQDFEATKAYLRIMGEKLAGNALHIEQLLSLSVRDRLVRTIAIHQAQGTLPQLSKEQVVQEVCAPLRSVNRAIAQCAQEGLFYYRGKRFQIPDPQRLQAYRPAQRR